MKTINKYLLLFSLFFSMSKINAQELSHVFVQGHPDFIYGFGGGASLDFSFPVSRGNHLMVEPGMEFFGNKAQWILIFPILVGYRYSLIEKGYGLYIQPVSGYTIGSTAITETNASGDTVKAKGNGFTAGLGIGYAFKDGFFQGEVLELRYTRVFITEDPQISMLSLRWTSTISFKRKKAQ